MIACWQINFGTELQIYLLICWTWSVYIWDQKLVNLELSALLYFEKKKLQKLRIVKPSVGRHMHLWRGQSSFLWPHNTKSKVYGVFIAGIFSEFIKRRRYLTSIIFAKGVQFVRQNGNWHFDFATSALTILLDRGRKYGVSVSQKLAHIKTHFWNPKQM